MNNFDSALLALWWNAFMKYIQQGQLADLKRVNTSKKKLRKTFHLRLVSSILGKTKSMPLPTLLLSKLASIIIFLVFERLGPGKNNNCGMNFRVVLNLKQ